MSNNFVCQFIGPIQFGSVNNFLRCNNKIMFVGNGKSPNNLTGTGSDIQYKGLIFERALSQTGLWIQKFELE